MRQSRIIRYVVYFGLLVAVALLLIFPPGDPSTLVGAWLIVATLGVLFISRGTGKGAPPK